ncbi:cell adhesion molecule CEACAM8-like [Lissotriton helveticus]
MSKPLKSWSVPGASFRALLHTVWVTSLFQCTAAQLSITPDVVTAAVGDIVTLSLRYEGGFRYCNWYRSGGTDAKDQILGLDGSDRTYGLKYTDREAALPDGSLRITDVQTNYTGNYTVQMTVDSRGLQEATAQLRVYALVTKPTVTMTNLRPVEYKDTVTVTCNTSGAAERIQWFFDRQHLLINNSRTHLSKDNRTLRITNVTRLDSGIYQCKASNPISNITSDPQTLAVSYGPEDTRIDPSGTQILEAGESFSLNCYTRSVPEIDTYEWFINNTSLTFHKMQLSVFRVSSKDEGNYTCVTRNPATGKTSNASVFIAVKDRDPQDDTGSMSASAIVGIVIASLVAVILVVVLVYYCRTKSSTEQSTAGVISTGATHHNNGAETNATSRGDTEELQYMAVHFEPKTGKATAPPPLENTIYSQVKATHRNALPPNPPSAETAIYSLADATCEGQSVQLPPPEITKYSQVKATRHVDPPSAETTIYSLANATCEGQSCELSPPENAIYSQIYPPQ